MTIEITRAQTAKPKPDPAEIGFGSHTSDHIFFVDYCEPDGWHNQRIEPYRSLSLDPTALVLHYGCSIFEGIKIFRQADGRLVVFRPDANAARLNASARLMALPELPRSLFLDGLRTLINTDSSWAPANSDYTLYARPVMIGTQATLGVQRPHECLFYILLTPVPHYYVKGQTGFNLLADRLLAREGNYSVASSKTAGNYGKMVVPTDAAREDGFDNILWLGGPNQNEIEEAGITNVFVVFEDRVMTPPLNGKILAGVTRDSTITLLRQRGITVEETPITIETLCEGLRSGAVREVFLTGTATVVAPVNSITFEQMKYSFSRDQEISSWVYDQITGIQTGSIPDTLRWLYYV